MFVETVEVPVVAVAVVDGAAATVCNGGGNGAIVGQSEPTGTTVEG